MLMMAFPRILLISLLLLLTGFSTANSEVFPRFDNATIQDKAQLFSDQTATTLRQIAEQDGRFIRIVVIADHNNYGVSGSFQDYVDALAKSWRIAKRADAILVIHETGSDRAAIRLGAGYSDQDREMANQILRRRYLLSFRTHHYDSAHIDGLYELLKLDPAKPQPASSPDPVAQITLKDTGQVIQDHVGVLAPLSVAPLRAEMESYRSKGIIIRLVAIQRHSDFGGAKTLGQFGNRVYEQWGMAKKPGSVLVLYEAQSNKILLRISNSFSRQSQINARNALTHTYNPLLAKHKFSRAHNWGIRAILLGLVAPDTQSRQASRQPVIRPFNKKQLVQDSANILSPETIAKMRSMLNAQPHPPLHIVTVPDRLARRGNPGMTKYAFLMFQSWGLSNDPDNILLLHNFETQQIRMVFGQNYTLADQHRIRSAVKTAALPALRQYDENRAHILGLRALLDTLVNISAPRPVPTLNTRMSLNDLAGVVTVEETRKLQQLFKTQAAYGQPVRLVIVEDYRQIEPDKSLLTFTTDLFHELDLKDNSNAVMVLHDISRNRFMLKMGRSYDQETRTRARHYFYGTYRGTPDSILHISYIKVMKALLAELPTPIGPKPVARVEPTPRTQTKEQASPLVLGLLGLVISIVIGGALRTYYQSSTPRRERAARIAAFKRQRQDKP